MAINWDGGVSVIYPSPTFSGDRDEWLRRHDLDIAEQYLELDPIQLPASREDREFWAIEDGRVIIKKNRDSKIKEIDYTDTESVKRLDMQEVGNG